jgi:hypothetical protein
MLRLIAVIAVAGTMFAIVIAVGAVRITVDFADPRSVPQMISTAGYVETTPI